jgi:hypothetical protein
LARSASSRSSRETSGMPLRVGANSGVNRVR